MLFTGWDHPRLRGEKVADLTGSRDIEGSPPLTRGKVSTAIHTYGDLGITPAYAGKSYSNFPEPLFVKDHPRLRGEKAVEKPNFQSVTGSPPLTRGKA